MTDDIRQSTLIELPEGRKSPDAGRLTLFDLAALRVLELSRTEAAPLTPSTRLTRRLLVLLSQRGWIRIVAEDQPDTAHVARSVYEPISWTGAGTLPRSQCLRAALRAYVHSPAGRESASREQLDLWLALAEAELEGYARHLLRAFPAPQLALDRLSASLPVLLRSVSIVSVRRALWTYLRGPRSLWASSIPAASEARFADGLAARVVAASLHFQSSETNLQFLPADQPPPPLLRRVFTAEICRLGLRYWACTPSLSSLNPDIHDHGKRSRSEPTHRR